jgi:transposase
MWSGSAAVAISQQAPTSSRAIAMVTIPAGLPRPLRTRFLSRQRPAGVGRPGLRPGDRRALPRCPRQASLRRDRAGLLRHGVLDRGAGRRAAPQRGPLRGPVQTNQPLYQAYLLKEHLRQIYRLPTDDALNLLGAWLEWARESTLAPFQRLADTITEQRAGIEAAIEHGLSNARVEAINTQIRLLTRRAFGFHSANALLALAMLSLTGLRPPLPW